jgi:Putative MetA-pathway of phenol degradation
MSSALSSFGSPVLARLGVSDRIEARIGADGWVERALGRDRQSGFGNIQAGAKLRLVSDSAGTPVLSAIPMINLPTASASKGLGSGDADVTLTLAGGADLGARAHVDANYGVGKIGAGDGQGRFTQHLVSVAGSVSAGRWDPYAELFWFSAQELGGSGVSAFDVGTSCHLRDRLTLDGGLQVGLQPCRSELQPVWRSKRRFQTRRTLVLAPTAACTYYDSSKYEI